MPRERIFKIRPAPVVITRSFDVPRSMLWKAWSRPEELRRWFSPLGFNVKAADVDFRVGGAFTLQLHTRDGFELVSNGEYTSIAEPDRLAFRSSDRKFASETIVTFTEQDGGTLLTIHQDYEVYAPGFLAVVAGAPDAWQTTLDKLETEIDRIRESIPA